MSPTLESREPEPEPPFVPELLLRQDRRGITFDGLLRLGLSAIAVGTLWWYPIWEILHFPPNDDDRSGFVLAGAAPYVLLVFGYATLGCVQFCRAGWLAPRRARLLRCLFGSSLLIVIGLPVLMDPTWFFEVAFLGILRHLEALKG
jgi:hypothetical protein